MPLEYNSIHHGRFCQLSAELSLSPDDIAAILGCHASMVKRWYKGALTIPEHQLNPLWELYLNWLKWVDITLKDINHQWPEQSGYIVYTNQLDYIQAPKKGPEWPTYKVYLCLMSRAVSMNHYPINLVPYQQASYVSWLGSQQDTYKTRQQWANLIAQQTRS